MHSFGLWATFQKADQAWQTGRHDHRHKAFVATGFKTTRKASPASLEPGERELLRSLFADIITMLEPDTPAHEDPLGGPDRPGHRTPAARRIRALLRLLPDAVQGRRRRRP